MPVTAPNLFFAENRTVSEIKSEIIIRFFEAWHLLHYPSLQRENGETVLYIDLLADLPPGQDSPYLSPLAITALLVQSSGKKTDLNASVSTFFYNAAIPDAAALAPEVPHEELVHPPVVLHDAASLQQLTELLAAGLPAFAVLNPLENGLPNELLQSVLLAGKTDLCMLFEATALRKALAKGKAAKPLQDLLGLATYAALQDFYKKEKNLLKREEFFLPLFEKVFQDKGFLPLSFRIGQPESGLPGQYLVFAAGTRKSYQKMKEMLLPYTDFQADGVPAFGANQRHQQQLLLFPEHNRYALLHLMQDLLTKAQLYHYKSIARIAEDHSIATAYMPENYQQAFEKLRDQGKVQLINHKTMQPIKKSTPGSLVKFTAPATSATAV